MLNILLFSFFLLFFLIYDFLVNVVTSILFFKTAHVHNWAGALGWWLAPVPFTPEFGVWFPVSAV